MSIQPTLYRMQSFFLIVIASVYLSGCHSTQDAYIERPVEELYTEGRTYLNQEKLEKAAASFDEVERQHPYSEWAAQAQIMSAYCYYAAQKYEKSLTALESFIALHPAHADAAYAYYLRGLCYFEQTTAVERDQKVTELTLDAFQELVKKYPYSQYTRDARVKIELLRDYLAARHMEIGRYYQRRHAYTAAINRFKEVVLNYQTSSQVEEALHRLVELYTTIGMTTEARKMVQVLGHNFQGTHWYQDSHHLIDKATFNQSEIDQDMRTWKNIPISQRSNSKGIQTTPNSTDTTSYNDKDLTKPIERLTLSTDRASSLPMQSQTTDDNITAKNLLKPSQPKALHTIGKSSDLN